jgi:transketolase
MFHVKQLFAMPHDPFLWHAEEPPRVPLNRIMMSDTGPNIEELNRICKEVRRDVIRMTAQAGSGHPGGSLSEVEILVGLYWDVLRHDPKNPRWPERDYFILSKGHACVSFYSVLARRGYFPIAELMTLRKLGSILQGHPCHQRCPGVEVSTGSLGQGLSVACGIAAGLKMDSRANRVYCLLGDGEIQEGQIWEAAMWAGHRRLDNLCAVLDHNNLQIDGLVEDICGIEPVIDKWRSFRWHTIEIDGHDMGQVLHAYRRAAELKDKPTIIIAETTKGKGVSFMEDAAEWHSKAPTEEEAKTALAELS